MTDLDTRLRSVAEGLFIALANDEGWDSSCCAIHKALRETAAMGVKLAAQRVVVE